jgi:hypothetical protein
MPSASHNNGSAPRSSRFREEMNTSSSQRRGCAVFDDFVPQSKLINIDAEERKKPAKKEKKDKVKAKAKGLARALSFRK